MMSIYRFKKWSALLALVFCFQLPAADSISVGFKALIFAGNQLITEDENDRYKTQYVEYELPDLTFISHKSKAVALEDLLASDKPVILNFIFTSCPTICPVLSATFAKLQSSLQQQQLDVNLISVSIDPEHDTPAVLHDYAAKFNASDSWTFITGKSNDIVILQKSFESYRGDKMSHVPVYFMRTAASSRWLRIEGFPSIENIIAEYRRFDSA